MKKLLIILLLVPGLSWGEETFNPFAEPEACRDNPNYNASKSDKLINNRNVHYNKCLLKHSSNNSSLKRTDIIRVCWVLAKDKYPSKNYEGKYMNTPCED